VKPARTGQPPIFIAGFPRSGTTLLAGLLGAHSRLICGPETEFFTELEQANRGNRLCRAATWPEAAANYLFSIWNADRTVPENYQVSRAEILEFLRRRERSPQAILESLTETYRRRHGKPRWIEKTPTHLLHLRAVRRHYPDAPIVRILRDPRDVALSMLKVPWGPPSFASALLEWQVFDQGSAPFCEADRNTLTLRFEDLVHDPEGELRRVCRFLGEDFEPGMMDTSRSITHVNRTQEPWKQKAGEAIDAGRVGVWQRETTAAQQAQAEAIVGDRLRAYGYPTSWEFPRYVRVINPGTLGEFPALADHLLDGATRFWPARSGERPRMTIFVGDPCQQGWIGSRRSQRLARLLEVGACAVRAPARGIPLLWLGFPPADQRQHWGFLCRTLARLLPNRLAIDAFCARPPEPAGSVGASKAESN
jgi:hypothetical protein